jgi:hypothetical protein
VLGLLAAVGRGAAGELLHPRICLPALLAAERGRRDEEALGKGDDSRCVCPK